MNASAGSAIDTKRKRPSPFTAEENPFVMSGAISYDDLKNLQDPSIYTPAGRSVNLPRMHQALPGRVYFIRPGTVALRKN